MLVLKDIHSGSSCKKFLLFIAKDRKEKRACCYVIAALISISTAIKKNHSHDLCYRKGYHYPVC